MSQSQSWILRAPNVVGGAKPIDGGAPFPARTLLIETRSSQEPPTVPFDVAGNIVLQLTGLCRDGSAYYRRFAVGAWGGVAFYIEPFNGFEVEVLGSNMPGFDLVITATEGDEAANPAPLLLPEVRVAGTWLVPWGATEMVPMVADPGFSWLISDANGSLLTIPAPAVAGVVQQALGLRYTTTASPFGLVWRIRP